jgi:hypothetical protein
MPWCTTCRTQVPPGHATILSGTEQGSGTPAARYGCRPPATFVGRRDRAPEHAPRPA